MMHLGSAETRKLGLLKQALSVAALAVVALWSTSCGLLDTFRLETAEYVCDSPDLPPAFDGLRVAFVSDIHRGPYVPESRVGHVVDSVNALEPDLILLGGDYVYTGTKYEASCFAQLARLKAPLGVFAILGNHDYGRPDSASPGPEKAIQAAIQAGIPLLRNRGVWIELQGQRIRLGGVADYKASTSDFDPALEGTERSDFVLLLSHHPDFSEELPKNAVDLVLSGHTHGGQVTFFGRWALHVPSDYGDKYRSGIAVNDVTTVIVSNGVGTSSPLPVRLYAPAQIVVVTLRVASVASVHP